MRNVDTLIFHHSADSTKGEQFLKTQAYHNAGAPKDGVLQWDTGLGIQYHVFIERNGITLTRDTDAILYHAGDWNYRSVGICFAGDLRYENLTDAQIDAGVAIVGILQQNYPIKYQFNHYEIRNTQCSVQNVRQILAN